MEILNFKKNLERIDLIASSINYSKFGSTKKKNYRFKDIKIEKDLDYISDFQREKRITKYALITFIISTILFFTELNIIDNYIKNNGLIISTGLIAFISFIIFIFTKKLLNFEYIPANGCLKKDKIEKYYKDVYDIIGVEERQRLYRYEFYKNENNIYFIEILNDYKCIKNINDFKLFLEKIKKDENKITNTNIKDIYIGETSILVLPKNNEKFNKKCPNISIYDSSDLGIEKNIKILEENKKDFFNIETTLKTELIYI